MATNVIEFESSDTQAELFRLRQQEAEWERDRAAWQEERIELMVKESIQRAARLEFEERLAVLQHEKEEREKKLSAIMTILSDPTRTWKQRVLDATVPIAVSAQREASNPAGAFVVDTGALARAVGAIPPTPDDDPETRKRAFSAGKKLISEEMQAMAKAGSFSTYSHPPLLDETGEVTGMQVKVSTPLSDVELLRRTHQQERKPRVFQRPRGVSVRIDANCPDCGSLETNLACRACGSITDTADLLPETDPPTTGGGSPSDKDSSVLRFQRLESAEIPSQPASQLPSFQTLECEETTSQPASSMFSFQRLEKHSTYITTDYCGREGFSNHSDCKNPETTESEDATPRPFGPTDDPGIPAELTERRQWVCFDARKVPINPDTITEAASTDPSTWDTYAEVSAAAEGYRLAGVGFVFSADDPYTGVDLDHCRDADTGVIEPWACAIVEQLDSYTEVSPSGTGLHIIVRGELPEGRRKGGGVEMYDRGRYFTVTGNHLAGTPVTIEERPHALCELHRRVFPPTPKRREHRPTLGSDSQILKRAAGARNGDRFERLWRGDTGGYDSASHADLALCDFLAFWGADAGQIDALFRQSGLYRDKWDEKHRGDGATYGEMTIARATSRARSA